MFSKLSPAITKLQRMVLPREKGSTHIDSPAMEDLSSTLDRRGVFTEGIVVASGVGSYHVEVEISGRPRVGCNIAATVANSLMGATESAMLPEGTRVLVYLPFERSSRGIVVGVVPANDTFSQLDKSGKPLVTPLYPMLNLESMSSLGSARAYSQPYADPKNRTRVSANSNRPLDMLPGFYALRNEQQVGYATTTLAAWLAASSRAQVRVSAIDDQVRVVSNHFQHFNAGGLSQTFNDGGLITQEFGFTPYQPERAGVDDIGTDPFKTSGATQTVAKGSKQSALDKIRKRLAPKKRLGSFVGHLGDLINFFVSAPKEGENDESSTESDAGLMHTHVDGSGNILVRTAGSLTFQRSDTIPIPRRVRQPWDPEGDKPEDDWPPKPRGKFEFDPNQPWGRALELRDAIAYRIREAYWRLTQHGKDFKVPEEAETPTPPDEYDKIGGASSDYGRNKGRSATFSLEQDGSFIVRDAWGSELCMRGGNIILTCPGQLEIRSGKSTVVLAGHDLVLKGKESVDISATEKDVRVKAEKNLQVLGKGVVIESSAEKEEEFSESGEKADGGGVVIRAEKSAVVVAGKKTHISGERQVNIETFDKDGELAGEVNIATAKLQAATKEALTLTVDGISGLQLSPTTARLLGTTAQLVGSQASHVITGAEVGVFTKVDIGQNVYELVSPTLRKLYTDKSEVAWLQPFAPDQREDLRFSYRTSEEYGTLKGSEIEDADTFRIYQPLWAYLASKRVPPFADTRITAWRDKDIRDERPWPGTAAYEGESYVMLQEETNITPATGVSKSRKDLKPTSGAMTGVPFERYEVVAHT